MFIKGAPAGKATKQTISMMNTDWHATQYKKFQTSFTKMFLLIWQHLRLIIFEN